MHVGIQRGYPHLPDRLGAYLAMARPFTWLAPIGGAGSAAWMAVRLQYGPWSEVLDHWPRLACGALSLLGLVVASNCLNQACDPEDAVNKPYRPIVQGTASRYGALNMAWMSCVTALLLAMATRIGDFELLAVALATLTVLYNSGPRLKAQPGLGNACIAIARGGIGFLAAWSLWAPITAPPALLASLVLTIYLMGATTAKDFHDVVGDAQFGVRTLPVAFGAKMAAWISIPWIVAAGATLLVFRATIGVDGWLGGFALALMAALCYAMLALPERPNHLVEGSSPWPLMYAGLIGLQLALAS